jgi:hypothetical protein
MGPWSDLYSWALTIMGLVIRHRGMDGGAANECYGRAGHLVGIDSPGRGTRE